MKLGPDIKVHESHCLGCGTHLDAATHVNDSGKEYVPDDGAITICYKCGHVMAFDADTRLRELNTEEMYAVAGNKTLLLIVEAIGKVREKQEKTV